VGGLGGIYSHADWPFDNGERPYYQNLVNQVLRREREEQFSVATVKTLLNFERVNLNRKEEDKIT
jgi:hypothetical protein